MKASNIVPSQILYVTLNTLNGVVRIMLCNIKEFRTWNERCKSKGTQKDAYWHKVNHKGHILQLHPPIIPTLQTFQIKYNKVIPYRNLGL